MPWSMASIISRRGSVLLAKPQVARWHGLGQPHAVRAEVEDMAVAVHGFRVHGEHDGAAPAGADAGRGLAVGREVYVVAVHGAQSLGADRVQGARHRAVVEVRRRGRRWQAEVDVDAVALA